MYVDVPSYGRAERPLTIRYAYVLTRLHFDSFEWQHFRWFAFTYSTIIIVRNDCMCACVSVRVFMCVRVCVVFLSFLDRSLGWWAQITVYNSASTCQAILSFSLVNGGYFFSTCVQVYLYTYINVFVYTYYTMCGVCVCMFIVRI